MKSFYSRPLSAEETLLAEISLCLPMNFAAVTAVALPSRAFGSIPWTVRGIIPGISLLTVPRLDRKAHY